MCNYPCIPGIRPAWSPCSTLFLHCSVPTGNISLRTFSVSVREVRNSPTISLSFLIIYFLFFDTKVYSQINKYILSRASCLPQSVYPMGPSIAGGGGRGGPSGWAQALTFSNAHASIASALFQERESGEGLLRRRRGQRGLSAHRQGASCPSSLQLLRPVATPGRGGHPGLQQDQCVIRKERR